jgi:WD40 repeat protein
VLSVAYSPDGQNIVTGSFDNTIRIWDAQSGAAVGKTLTGHTGGVYGVSYSPVGHNIVSGSADNTIRVWYAHNSMEGGEA